MAESMKGLHRTHRCTEVSNQNIGETVTVMGWVQKRRNLGSLIFIDLRDRSRMWFWRIYGSIGKWRLCPWYQCQRSGCNAKKED